MENVTERFALRIKEQREKAGMTQAQLAEKLGVSRGAISYYEKAERTPDIEFLNSTCNLFDVTFEYMLGYTENSKVEYSDMSESFGLSDSACLRMQEKPSIGTLISSILEDKSFPSIYRLFKSTIMNYDDLSPSQLHYISYLISDLLNKSVFKALQLIHGKSLPDIKKNDLHLSESDIANKINESESLCNDIDNHVFRGSRLGKEMDTFDKTVYFAEQHLNN